MENTETQITMDDLNTQLKLGTISLSVFATYIVATMWF